MNWAGKKVLLTGAGGFIGSHLTEQLVRAGAEVRAFVRYTSRGGNGLLTLLPSEILREVQIIRGDLRDPEAVRRAVEGTQVVMNLAALIAIPYSYLHPTEVFQVNIIGSINVFNAALVGQVECVVQTSTSETYGTALKVPISEDHPTQPQSPYAASKVASDAIAHAYWRSFDLPVATIRPFNTYGPRQSGRAVIPTITNQALRGETITLGSLTPTRDFTYVTDIAEAFMMIAECDAAIGNVLNFGSGSEISIGDLAKIIVRRVGRDVPIVSAEERKRPINSEVERLVGDSTRARELTNWKPKVSLGEGLDHVIDFLRENPKWTRINEYEV